tara:strand:- start:231 stop:476 length:246 start_codon:yes stop_codon:yes gene_type:complete
MEEYENEMGLPKVYEDDIVMIFLIDEDEDSEEEETESMECGCKDKVEIKKKPHFSQGGISQFSMPPLDDKIEDIILSIIGG